jgi:hypothetical protein
VQAQSQPIPFDFGFLADQQLASASETVREVGGSRLWDLPFVKACRASLFQEGGLQRGLTPNQKQEVVVHRVSWNVVK